MSSNTKEYYIANRSTGSFIETCIGYKLEENKGVQKYLEIAVPKNSTFSIIRFNRNTKRVVLFLNIKETTTIMCEVDYGVLADKTVMDNADNLFSEVNCVYVVDRVKEIISNESIRDIISIIFTFIIGLLVGKVI